MFSETNIKDMMTIITNFDPVVKAIKLCTYTDVYSYKHEPKKENSCGIWTQYVGKINKILTKNNNKKKYWSI